MKKFEWLGLRHASNLHAFYRYDLERRRESSSPIWALERKCGWFTSSALGENERGELCPFCLRAVRRDWLADRGLDCVLAVRCVYWMARRVAHWIERRLWGRP